MTPKELEVAVDAMRRYLESRYGEAPIETWSAKSIWYTVVHVLRHWVAPNLKVGLNWHMRAAQDALNIPQFVAVLKESGVNEEELRKAAEFTF